METKRQNLLVSADNQDIYYELLHIIALLCRQRLRATGFLTPEMRGDAEKPGGARRFLAFRRALRVSGVSKPLPAVTVVP